MKITMELTVADLIRTLRWQAIELAEQAADTQAKVDRSEKAPNRAPNNEMKR